jgi:deoxyribose-phosphate aldolase
MTRKADLDRRIAAASQASGGADAARRALPLLDLTSLNDDDTEATIIALCERAVTRQGRVAAVCILAPFVALAKRRLAGTGVRIATVANFPEGTAAPEAVGRETAAAVSLGADEVDVVLPYRALLAGDRARGQAVLAAARAAAAGRVMKVILETGALGDRRQIAAASEEALAAGADFLKTSTGKLKPAATLEAAAVMLAAIRGAGRPIGFKAAGGIRDTAAAASYLALADGLMGPRWAEPATFRFGASGLLDALLADLGAASAVAGPAAGY